MLRSMTGFGRGENVHANRRYYAEVRTVNHRYLDISVKLPKHLYCLEERVIEHIIFPEGKLMYTYKCRNWAKREDALPLTAILQECMLMHL